MAEFDLTPKLTPYLDSHLVIPILNFLRSDKSNIYEKKQVLETEYNLLSASKMKDAQLDVHKLLLNGSPATPEPENITLEKNQILSELKELETKCQSILRVISDEESVKQAKEKNEFTVEFFGADTVHHLIRLAKLQYEIGNYKVASGYLYDLLELIQKSPSTTSSSSNNSNNTTTTTTPNLKSQLPSLALGKLSCEILLNNWDAVNGDLNTVKDLCLSSHHIYNAEEEQNQQKMRAFVAHWSLFGWAFGKSNLDFWLIDHRISTIIASRCAYLCRYLIVFLCLKHNRKSFLKDLKSVVKIIDQSGSALRNDPVTKFASLMVQAQFLDAGEQLLKMEPVLRNDFFCHGLANEMMSAARGILFEQYTKIHIRISIGKDFPLRKYLFVNGETEEEEQNWIANSLRQRVGGIVGCRMDTGHKLLNITENYPNIYQVVVEQTEASCVSRTNQLKYLIQEKASSSAAVSSK